jgi:hypothetical protein
MFTKDEAKGWLEPINFEEIIAKKKIILKLYNLGPF